MTIALRLLNRLLSLQRSAALPDRRKPRRSAWRPGYLRGSADGQFLNWNRQGPKQ